MVLEGGEEGGGRREVRRRSKRISELMGRFEEGEGRGGSEESGKLVGLETGSIDCISFKQFGKT